MDALAAERMLELATKPPEQYCDNCTKQGNYDTFQCPGAKCIPERDFDPKEAKGQ